MATIQKQGRGYKITVSQGRDYTGKKIRKYMTWVPEPGMTERQIKKELERQAVLFEEKVSAVPRPTAPCALRTSQRST